MSSKSSLDDLLGDSWVDVTASTCVSQNSSTPGSITPLLPSEEYLRLLREAQRESNQSSARVSLAGSRRDSPRGSPKSPPNSPVQGTPLNMAWQSYYLNSETRDLQDDFFSSWSSRPDQSPPKNWSFRHPKSNPLSIRYARVGDSSMFSRKGLCTLFLTNLLSLLIGAGVGLWLSKYGFFAPAVRTR